MNDSTTSFEAQLFSIGRAVRFGFAAMVFGLSYPNIRCAFGINHFRQIFVDMLGAKPLPSATALVLQIQPFLIGLSILIPLLALAFLFVPRLAYSIYASGVLVLLVFVQLFFTWHALTIPLFTIIEGMQQ